MEVISINQLRIALGKLALSNKFVNDFFWGDIDSMRSWKERIAQYPLVTAYSTGVQVNRNTKIVTINLEVSDKMYKDWNKNLNEIESDTAQILEDLFNAMRKMPEWQKVAIVENDTFNATKFINETGDVVAGWRASVSLKLSKKVGLCDSPFDTITPETPIVCEDATVKNSTTSPTYITTIPSGGTLVLPTENITVNGGLLVNKSSVEDYEVKVKNENGQILNVDLVNGEIIINFNYALSVFSSEVFSEEVFS